MGPDDIMRKIRSLTPVAGALEGDLAVPVHSPVANPLSGNGSAFYLDGESSDDLLPVWSLATCPIEPSLILGVSWTSGPGF